MRLLVELIKVLHVQTNSPSSLLLPIKMSIPSRLAFLSMVAGSEGMNSPSMVGAEGNPKIPEYEFHCCTEIVLASTDRMQFSTTRGDSYESSQKLFTFHPNF